MTRALQTIPQEPEADTSAEIYLTGAYFLLPLSLPFGSVLLLGLVALRVPGAQILAVGWYIFFLSFGPALFAVWCLPARHRRVHETPSRRRREGSG